MFFLFSGNRFFYLGDRQVVLVFNCAHLCIICNLEQCLSLVLQIKDCTQSKVEEHTSAVLSILLCHSQSGACPASGLFSKIHHYFCELKTWSNVSRNETSACSGVLQTLKSTLYCFSWKDQWFVSQNSFPCWGLHNNKKTDTDVEFPYAFPLVQDN